MNRMLKLWMAVWVAVALLPACASVEKKDRSAATAEAENKGPSPQYFDFGDVLVPPELEVDKESSFVYRTPGFSAGVLVMDGRVEMNSLFDFFRNNMAKDNWVNVSSFKSPRTIMLFQKENRWCVINMTDKQWNTDVEIWVAPTLQEMAPDPGLLK